MKNLSEFYDVKSEKDGIEDSIKKANTKLYKNPFIYTMLGVAGCIVGGCLLSGYDLSSLIPMISVFAVTEYFAVGCSFACMKVDLAVATMNLTNLLFKIKSSGKVDDFKISVNDLEKVVVLKEAVETNEIKNDEQEVIKKDYYFVDRDKYLRCLREIRTTLVTDNQVQTNNELYLLEKEDFDDKTVMTNSKIKKLGEKKGLSSINYR